MAFPGFGDHHQTLGAGRRIVAAEDGDVAFLQPFQAPDGILQLGRMDIAAGADDDVLGAAADMNIAAGHIGQVAGIQPFAVEQLGRRPGIAEIAAGGRRPQELKTALAAFGHFPPGVIDDADLMSRQGPAAVDHGQRPGVVLGRLLGAAGFHEHVAPNAVDGRAPAEGWKSKSHRAFGQAVDRHHGMGAETIRPEPFGEPLHGFGIDGLGAVQGQPPRTQIQAFDCLIADPPETKLKGEVGGRGKRPAGVVNGPQPAFRLG